MPSCHDRAHEVYVRRRHWRSVAQAPLHALLALGKATDCRELTGAADPNLGDVWGTVVVSRRTETSEMGGTMTADENAAIMRRAYAAFNSADLNRLNELFDEGAVWHLPGRSRFADDYRGREATLAYFAQLGQETGGTF